MTDRYYIVNQHGMATLCADLQDATSSAAEADEMWPTVAPHTVAVMLPLSAYYMLLDQAANHCEQERTMVPEHFRGTRKMVGESK